MEAKALYEEKQLHRIDEKMMGATSFAEKGVEVTKALGNLCAAILGVDTIIENCPGIKSTYNKVKKKLGK